MYTELVGILALGCLILAILKKKTNGPWMWVVMAASFVLGTATLIQQLLAPVLNGCADALSNLVFQGDLKASTLAVEGGFSVSVVGLGLAVIIYMWRDGHIKGWELPVLVVACMAVGSTPLVTTWLPSVLNIIG